jgi:FKBP-type peptidyl-prolyl cis-trans isomerase SlyD
METAENKYITVAYKLYTTEDGKRDLVEETAAEHPFQFISGLGTTLEAFESQIVKETNLNLLFLLPKLMVNMTKNM